MLFHALSASVVLTTLTAVTSAIPFESWLTKRQSSAAPNTVQNWANDFADVDFTLGSNGSFTTVWDNNPGGNFVVGRGYRPGKDMLVNYTGSFYVNGWAYLALYGWTTDPLVEYYVIEAMGQHNPSDNASATQYGTLQSDGATYEIWQKERINAPSIIGDNTDFQQYWSIRTSMHCGGTINTGNHFRAWEAAGLKLGKQNYMVMGIEGQQGRGSATITVGVAPTTRVPETTTSTYRSIRRTTTTRRSTSSTSTRRPTTTSSTRRPPATPTRTPAVPTSAAATSTGAP